MDAWSLITSVLGATGGLIGVWSGVVTLRRDRSHLRLDVRRELGQRDNLTADKLHHFIAPPDNDVKLEWAVAEVMNIGNRPVRIRTFTFYLYSSDGNHGFSEVVTVDNVVLDETRRSFTCAYDLTTGHDGVQFIACDVKDDLGRRRRAFYGRTIRWRLSAIRYYFAHQRFYRKMRKFNEDRLAEWDVKKTVNPEQEQNE